MQWNVPLSDFRLGIARVSLKFFKVVRATLDTLAPFGAYYGVPAVALAVAGCHG